MNTVWIGNGRTVLPDGVVMDGSVLLQGDKIAAVNIPCPEGVQKVDARDGYILPGFIDIHLHGGGGADFMDAEPDSLKTMARAHNAHGTTSMVATTMTCADELLEKAIDTYIDQLDQPTGGAKILGLHLEGPFFSAASKGAQPISKERIPTREYLESILKRAQGHILRWDAAPELENMDLFAQVMKENGVLCSLAHSGCNATRALQAFDWGFRHVTHFYNACTTYHKENGLVHSGIIEATYIRDDVTIELIGDGRHIPRESMLLAFRIKGPDRICLITDAMRAAGTSDQTSILGPKIGGTPVVVKDDVAQLTDFSSYAGSICTMDRALRVAHTQYGIPLADVSRMLSLTPARLSGVADRTGSLEVGKDADIVVMDGDFQVRRVYTSGVLTAENES